MTRGFIKSKKLYGHRNTRSGIVQQLEIIQHKDRPSRLYSFSSEFVAKGQKAKRMLVALYNTYLVVRIATIDYEELKDPRNFASRSQIARRFALYNQTLLLQATSIHYFTTPRDPRWFFNFPKLSYSCTIFKNSSSLKIRTPISCALSSFDPASSPANT